MNISLEKIIEEVEKDGQTLEIISTIKKGKEAMVYKVLLDGYVLAMKVYIDPEHRAFKKTNEYLAGKFYKTKSHGRAVAKGGKFGKKLRHENWIRREFYMLENLFQGGALVPKPIKQVQDTILMEFIGDDHTAAPRLIDVVLTKEQANAALKSILDTVKILWNCGVVHADLSPYNILWWNNTPYLIDFPQSLDTRTHPNPESILERDLRNIIKYFKKYLPVDEETIMKEFLTI